MRPKKLDGPLHKFLLHLHDIKAFEEHIEGGKKLAGHQTNTAAPLSTFFFTLRTPMSGGEKKGPLTEDDIRSIANDIYNAVRSANIEFDAVAGIPNAGNPIVLAFVETYVRLNKKPIRLVRLDKSMSRRNLTLMTVAARDRPKKTESRRERVLLLDDLITGSNTKWIAINALRRVGYEVAGIGVFIDREQGGSTNLRESGIPFAAVVTARDAIELYRDRRRISKENAKIHLDYLAKTKK